MTTNLPSEDRERSELQALLQRSQEQFSSLINSLDGIVWEADAASLRNTFVSHRAERLLGYPQSAWIAEPNFWLDHLHPDDRAGAEMKCLQAMREMRDCEVEYRMIARDGRTVWLRDYVTMVIAEGRLVKVRGVMVDITERKKAEEALRESEARLHAIVHNTPNVAVQGYDLDGRVCFWNDASARMFGFTTGEAIGRTLDQLIHTPEETAGFVKILRNLSKSGKSVGPSEYHFRR